MCKRVEKNSNLWCVYVVYCIKILNYECVYVCVNVVYSIPEVKVYSVGNVNNQYQSLYMLVEWLVLMVVTNFSHSS